MIYRTGIKYKMIELHATDSRIRLILKFDKEFIFCLKFSPPKSVLDDVILIICRYQRVF